MRELCDHVERALYRELVFCATSMHALLVSQHLELEWNCGMLRVELSANDLISFALHEQPFVELTSFRSAPEKVIETFEGFLQKNKWAAVTVLSSPV